MINFTGKNPLYIDIANFYKNLIDNGLMHEGEKLPSVRELALSEGVNPMTVQKSFTYLVEEGYVLNMPKKGFIVCKKPSGDKYDLLRKELRSLIAQGFTKEEIINEVKKAGIYYYD